MMASICKGLTEHGMSALAAATVESNLKQIGMSRLSRPCWGFATSRLDLQADCI